MARFVTGVTLTPEERITLRSNRSARGELVRSHTCDVLLPNRIPCPVHYRRCNPRCHQFDFADPLHKRQWFMERLEGGIPAIEAKAAELAQQAFHRAQQEEQKQMKRKTPPPGRRPRKVDTGPEMDTKTAEQCAGKYAVCVRFASGRLIRIGGMYDRSEQAAQEIREGKHAPVRLVNEQRLVVGICNRVERRWQEPQFLSVPVVPAEDDPVATEAVEADPVQDTQATTPARAPRSRRAKTTETA